MKKIHLTIAMLVLITLSSAAQIILPYHDSLRITKPKLSRGQYHINHSGLSEISLTNKEPKPAQKLPRKPFASLPGGMLTLLTGLETSHSTDGLWMFENELASANPLQTWRVLLFCEGELVKDRERVKNDDGSVSLETTKSIQIKWNRGARGLIVENSDTVGIFSLSINLQDDSVISHWLSPLRDEGMTETNKLKTFYKGTGRDVMIQGVFREQPFSMLRDGTYFRSVITMKKNPVAVFQAESDYPTLNKKNRIPTYIQFSPDATESRSDLIRLSLMNTLIARSVNVDSFEK